MNEDQEIEALERAKTLRVKGGTSPTDPGKLSRSILHVLKEHDHVKIMAVGPIANEITLRAFRMASKEVEDRTKGSVLVCRQSEYTAKIGENNTTGVCTRIFGVPIKYAL